MIEKKLNITFLALLFCALFTGNIVAKDSPSNIENPGECAKDGINLGITQGVQAVIAGLVVATVQDKTDLDWDALVRVGKLAGILYGIHYAGTAGYNYLFSSDQTSATRKISSQTDFESVTGNLEAALVMLQRAQQQGLSDETVERLKRSVDLHAKVFELVSQKKARLDQESQNEEQQAKDDAEIKNVLETLEHPASPAQTVAQQLAPTPGTASVAQLTQAAAATA